MSRSKKCTVCEDRPVTSLTGMRICDACYQAFYYWKDKTPKQILDRSRNLDIYARRMDLMLGNVKRVRRKKTA